MLNGTASAAERELQALAQRFGQWRASRTHRSEPIPAVLWNQAVQLTDVLPIGRITQTLRLSGGELKRRRQARSPSPSLPPAKPATAEFIELTPAPASQNTRATGTSVELQRPDGARLSIHYPDASPPLAELIGAFLASR